MAVISNSTQYTAQQSVARSGEPGDTRTFFFSGTTVNAAQGEINFITLPPGRIRVIPGLSSLIMANGAATANVSVGHAAYKAANGVAVAANAVLLQAARLVNAHIAATSNLVPVNAGVLFDSQDGIVIQGTVSTANTAANGAYEGTIVFAYLG